MKDLPVSLVTSRLLLRPPGLEDAPALNEAIRESFEELNAWMEWASKIPSVSDTRTFCEDAVHRHREGRACPMMMLGIDDNALIGMTGYARIDWAVPAFEIGYWCRTPLCRQGYVTEAVDALTRHAFEELGANRVEIRMDADNARSVAVPQRLGFELEGVIRHHGRDHHGRLRDTCIYAKIRPQPL